MVLTVDGNPVKDGPDMRNHVGLLRVGSELTMEILRDGSEETLTAVIVEHKIKKADGGKLDRRLAGSLLSLQKRAQRADETQIVVEKVIRNSPAQRNGLRSDDIILSINRRSVSDFEEMEDVIDEDKVMLLRLKRADQIIFYALRP